MSFRPYLSLRPALSLSLMSLARPFSSTPPATSTGTKCTRFLIRRPSPAATRESPTPLVFLRAALPVSSAAEATQDPWADWSSMLAEKGWTGYEIDLESTPSSSSSSKDSILAQAAELRSQIRLMAIPFPPVLLASGPACLVAQAYVEDNPASGLVMLHPPPDDVVKQEGLEFRYEPHFPVLLLGDAKSIGGIRASRVGSAAERGVGRGGKGVSVESLVDGDRGEESRLVSYPQLHFLPPVTVSSIPCLLLLVIYVVQLLTTGRRKVVGQVWVLTPRPTTSPRSRAVVYYA